MTEFETDRPAKLARLQELLDARSARAIVLTTPESLAWFFDGPRVSVTYGGPAVLAAVVGRDGSITANVLENEFDRLRSEELGSQPGVEFRSVRWHEPLSAPVDGMLRDVDLEAEMRTVRAPLLPAERDRYRALGSDAARAMTAVLRSARPESTERWLAAELARAVLSIGAEPVVLLVAGQARAGVQHPLPTTAPLGRRAIAVVGARRHGLVANLTRWLDFDGRVTTEEAGLREVEADAFAATRPGRELRDVLVDIAVAYARHGFGDQAWQRHHQGGPTGYLGRDPKVTPGSRDLVVAGQAFAWNPWVPGAKLEDTVIVDANRVEVLTADPAWPTVDVRGIPRPVALTP